MKAKRKMFSHNTITKLKKIKKCQKCHIKKILEKHHIVPLSKGGTNNIKNIKMLCKGCHKKEDEEAL